MLMSVLESMPLSRVYPEIAGLRVLITGVGSACGIDVARAFAEHGARLMLQIPEASAEADALIEVLAPNASELRVRHDALVDAESTTLFAQSAVQDFGGFDVVVNLIPLALVDLPEPASMDGVEDWLAEWFSAPCLLTRIAANRMRLTWAEGLILNVLSVSRAKTRRQASLAQMARSALQSLTRAEARQWAAQGVRINGIGPGDDGADVHGNAGGRLPCEADIAAMALVLASRRGKSLSGLVFDAGASATACADPG